MAYHTMGIPIRHMRPNSFNSITLRRFMSFALLLFYIALIHCRFDNGRKRSNAYS